MQNSCKKIQLIHECKLHHHIQDLHTNFDHQHTTNICACIHLNFMCTHLVRKHCHKCVCSDQMPTHEVEDDWKPECCFYLAEL